MVLLGVVSARSQVPGFSSRGTTMLPILALLETLFQPPCAPSTLYLVEFTCKRPQALGMQLEIYPFVLLNAANLLYPR